MVEDSGDRASILHLTSRFTRAVDYARNVHVGTRKSTEVPYIAHLLGVASLVLGEAGEVPFPITEDIAIAALLHDAVEDAGGLPRLRDIEANFGSEVARIVEAARTASPRTAPRRSRGRNGRGTTSSASRPSRKTRC